MPHVATTLCILWISVVCPSLGISKTWLLSQPCFADSWVVDLRGQDRASGHIRGTVHVPAMDLLKQIQTYVEEFRHQPIVAFFCQYSAHRAPTVAGCILTYCNNMLAVHFRFLISRVVTKPFQKRQFQQGETKATRSPTSTARAAPPSSV